MVFVIDIRVCFLFDFPHFRLNDMQDLYNQPISKLVEFIVAAYHINPSMTFEVFVHKAEKLQEEDKIGVYLNASTP